jgi:hypothetical protein
MLIGWSLSEMRSTASTLALLTAGAAGGVGRLAGELLPELGAHNALGKVLKELLGEHVDLLGDEQAGGLVDTDAAAPDDDTLANRRHLARMVDLLAVGRVEEGRQHRIVDLLPVAGDRNVHQILLGLGKVELLLREQLEVGLVHHLHEIGQESDCRNDENSESRGVR